MHQSLDIKAKPPSDIRKIYKHYQQLSAASLDRDPNVICLKDVSRSGNHLSDFNRLDQLPDELRQGFVDFLEPRTDGFALGDEVNNEEHGKVLDLPLVPGLRAYPSLLPNAVQLELLNKLLHRDLVNTQHQTNVHLHHHVTYPQVQSNAETTSFFGRAAAHLVFQPKDGNMHKPLSNQQLLNRKLRWMTLGGQYDWTNKVYPKNTPPFFPADTKQLMESLFPMKAEAAIVNVYSPSDTLSLHRDVSEECDRPLVSISLGCDALFIAGLEGESSTGESRVAAIRLRSGDALLMTGESRYAWHGVPQVLKDTCPEWMQDWPCNETQGSQAEFEPWKGWMKHKRINLNVRQMFA